MPINYFNNIKIYSLIKLEYSDKYIYIGNTGKCLGNR